MKADILGYIARFSLRTIASDEGSSADLVEAFRSQWGARVARAVSALEFPSASAVSVVSRPAPPPESGKKGFAREHFSARLGTDGPFPDAASFGPMNPAPHLDWRGGVDPRVGIWSSFGEIANALQVIWGILRSENGRISLETRRPHPAGEIQLHRLFVRGWNEGDRPRLSTVLSATYTKPGLPGVPVAVETIEELVANGTLTARVVKHQVQIDDSSIRRLLDGLTALAILTFGAIAVAGPVGLIIAIVLTVLILIVRSLAVDWLDRTVTSGAASLGTPLFTPLRWIADSVPDAILVPDRARKIWFRYDQATFSIGERLAPTHVPDVPIYELIYPGLPLERFDHDTLFAIGGNVEVVDRAPRIRLVGTVNGATGRTSIDLTGRPHTVAVQACPTDLLFPRYTWSVVDDSGRPLSFTPRPSSCAGGETIELVLSAKHEGLAARVEVSAIDDSGATATASLDIMARRVEVRTGGRGIIPTRGSETVE